MPDNRQSAIDGFLARAGWGAAERTPLAGDASARRYFRLIRAGSTAVLMDAPMVGADDPAQFLHIADHLLRLGLSAPKCVARDLTKGFLLLEDLGDALFARILATDPGREQSLFQQAVDVLITLQSHAAPPGLPDLTAQDWAQSAMLAISQYRRGITGDDIDTTPLQSALEQVLAAHADGPRNLILRDYHSENLLFLPDRIGNAKVGLLDFQLAQMGQPGYDLVSLLQDARRDVHTEAQIIRYFITRTGREEADFATQYAALGALRALRILGIFAQLCLKAGKPGYLPMMPRVYAQLLRNLSHPKLSVLRSVCMTVLPEPSARNLERLRSQCGHFQ